MWGFVGSLVKLWGALPGGIKGFTLGIAAGVMLSVATSLVWPRHDPSDRIALQNATAALDSTRAIVAQHDTLFARIIAQKDVRFSGAMAEVKSLRGDKAKLSAKLDIAVAEAHTTASHTQPVPGSGGQGPGAGKVSGPTAYSGVDGGNPSVADTLVLPGPPVVGSVAVTVTAQPDTTVRFDWDARLRPSPVHLEVGLGCGKDGPELVAHGPDFAHVEIQPSEVDSDVCNPSVRVGLVERGLEVVGGAAVIAGIVKVVAGILK